MNLLSHNKPLWIDSNGEALSKILGKPLSGNLTLSTSLPPAVMPRLISPVVRDTFVVGEVVTFRVIALTPSAPSSIVLYWRPLDGSKWRALRMQHTGNNVFVLKRPTSWFLDSFFQYYYASDDGTLRWPGEQQWQTVMIFAATK